MQMHDLIPYLPILIPLVIVELGLVVAALVSIAKHKNFKIGNKVIWIIVVIVLSEFIGPILYFTIGRSDD